MRLSEPEAKGIRRLAEQIAGKQARVRLFGSRLDDDAKGGDVDILLELDTPTENPALMSVRLAARVSRALGGRKVDVVLSAPNLMHLPIHDIALAEGRLL